MIPLISILIPAYQAEKTIYRCLKSVSEQTNNNYEVIVVDDGSTDKTMSICQSFAKNEKLRLYYQDNIGVAATRQKLINLAAGEYLQFVDADDWVAPNMIEMYSGILQNKHYDMVISDFIVNDANHIKYVSQKPQAFTSSALIRAISSSKMLGVLWNKLIHKKFFLSLSFPSLNYCEDWCVCVSIFQKIKSVYYNKNAFYYYDITNTSNSLTRNINYNSFNSRIEYINYLKAIKFNKLYPKEYNSRVANIAYTAIVYNIYTDVDFFQIFDGISFWNNYNCVYKKVILTMSRFFRLSFVRRVDSFIRRIFRK